MRRAASRQTATGMARAELSTTPYLDFESCDKIWWKRGFSAARNYRQGLEMWRWLLAEAFKSDHQHSWRLAVAFGLLLLAGLSLGASSVLAQRCSADVQCRDSGRPRTWCSGNTLVTRQSMCRGSCVEVEVSRVPCPGPCAGDRCVGGPLSSSPAVPPSGRSSYPAGVCAKVCSCNGKRLTYGLGYARKAEQCQRRSVDCKFGCTCDPEPRCLKQDEV